MIWCELRVYWTEEMMGESRHGMGWSWKLPFIRSIPQQPHLDIGPVHSRHRT